MPAYSAIILEHVAEECREGVRATPELERQLADMIRSARAAWPDVQLSDEAFLSYVAERWDGDASGEKTLEHGCALYIACACATGDEQAVAAFRGAYNSTLEAAVRPIVPEGLVEDICQQLLARLFVSDADSAPAIRKYTGRGGLKTWLRVVATRDAYRLSAKERKKQKREIPRGDDALFEGALEAADPELAFLKESSRSHFKAAFQRAFANLSTRQRNLLRHEHLHGLNLDELAHLYNVGRSTVARWRVKARDQLLSETRKILLGELDVSRRELDSMMTLIQSQLDVSLTRLLMEPTKGDG